MHKYTAQGIPTKQSLVDEKFYLLAQMNTAKGFIRKNLVQQVKRIEAYLRDYDTVLSQEIERIQQDYELNGVNW
jgi:N-formylglutamate amidohydrolase